MGLRRCFLALGLVVAGAGGSAIPAGAAVAPVDPFATGAMRSFLHSRAGDVTAAVENLWTGRTYLYRPGVAEHTASIVKVDILETLLHELHGSPLPPGVAGTAQGMIEFSDNNDATALWNREGGAPAVAAYDRLIGMSQTRPNGAWGLTSTTALDQIKLLRQLVDPRPPGFLTPGGRAYELGLMGSVTPSQRWGVSGGVPGGVGIALKNGWLPEHGGWQINSIGHIDGGERDYLIAVLTSGNPSEGYGIGTIQGIAAITFAELAEQEAGMWGYGVEAGGWGPTSETAAAGRAAAREGERRLADRASG